MSEYTFEEKKKLATRIEKLTSKIDLSNIKTIIEKNNTDLQFVKNKNGYFAKFNNLSNETYVLLTKYMDKLERKKLKELESEIMKSEIISEIKELASNSEKKPNKKLRLTNTESHILNRARYEKELKKNEDDYNKKCADDENNKNKGDNPEDIFIKNTNSQNKKNKK